MNHIAINLEVDEKWGFNNLEDSNEDKNEDKNEDANEDKNEDAKKLQNLQAGMTTWAYITTNNICGETAILSEFDDEIKSKNTTGLKVYEQTCASLGYTVPDGSGSMKVPEAAYSDMSFSYDKYTKILMLI